MRRAEPSRPYLLRRARRHAALIVVVTLAAVLGLAHQRTTHARYPLLSQTAAIDGQGRLLPVRTGRTGVLYPGTRVLVATGPAGAAARARAVRQREWLRSGSIPGAGGPYAAMSADALLDLRTLLLPNGALVAGTPGPWHYVWPRDSSFAAVALARTGHWRDAADILAYLQAVQPASGLFQARYLPDGSGRVPDARGVQSDGVGWVLWAADETVRAAPDAQARASVLHRLQPMIETSTAAAMHLTSGHPALPPASQDYWEITDHRLSLGTAAPIALGLSRGADLLAMLDQEVRSGTVRARADAAYTAIYDHFGPYDYPRYLDGFTRDASVTFLLPGFGVSPHAGVVQAYRRAMDTSRQPGGGNRPGSEWSDDAVSWTPQTALFALTAASLADGPRARRTLDWLTAHRTAFGSVPEKVRDDGRPGGPAPVALSAAVVVLAVAALTDPPHPSP